MIGQAVRTTGRSKNEGGEPISVAILAGGMSRRMGQDKALLRIAGRTLLEHVAVRVRSLTDDLFVVATRGERYADLGLRVVPDLVTNSGSLGGIYSAIKTARHEHCLVVACDMPFLNHDLLRFMAELPRDYDVLVPLLSGERSDQGEGRTYETLHAIYARSAAAAIERQLSARRFKVAALMDVVRVQVIDEATVRRFDPGLRSFFNANRPDDVALLEQSIFAEGSR